MKTTTPRKACIRRKLTNQGIIFLSGILLFGASQIAGDTSSKIKIPSPVFDIDGLSWGSSAMLSNEKLLMFHKQHASIAKNPNFCIGTDIVSTFLDHVSRDRCYFEKESSGNNIFYSVTDCIYDSEWKDMKRVKPVECTRPLSTEAIDRYKGGKASRYFGDKSLLIAEIEINNIKSLLAISEFVVGILGLLVCVVSGVNLATMVGKK